LDNFSNLPDQVPARWSLSDGGKVIVSGTNASDAWIGFGRGVGSFNIGHGRYTLDVHLLTDQGSLDKYHPRLAIYESGGGYLNSSAQGSHALLLFLLCAPVGICTIIYSTILRRAERHAALLGSYSFTQPGSFGGLGLRVQFRRAMRSPVARPFSSLSMTSMILVLVLVTILTFFVGLHSGDRVPTGLRIHISRPGVVAQRVAGIQPIRVRVATTGVYLNFHLVDRDDFGSILRTELKQRPPDWPVYVEGDPNLEWKSVAQVIDAIRGQQAEVVLLTQGN
jgi:biopolymer transport protein ExbD